MLSIEGARPTDATTEEHDLPAGRFSAWLVQIGRARDADVEVPCGTCTACCTSSQFINIGPDELATTSRIPSALLFPAPGRPQIHETFLSEDEPSLQEVTGAVARFRT